MDRMKTIKKVKPKFADWLLFDETPFWVVTRMGFIGTSIILILMTGLFTYKAFTELEFYLFLAPFFAFVTYKSIKGFWAMWKHIKLLNKSAIIDNVPISVQRMNGIKNPEECKKEYRDLYK